MKRKMRKLLPTSSFYLKVYIKKPFFIRRIFNRIFGLRDKNKYIFTKVSPEKATL